jgi:hypothetical protein
MTLFEFIRDTPRPAGKPPGSRLTWLGALLENYIDALSIEGTFGDDPASDEIRAFYLRPMVYEHFPFSNQGFVNVNVRALYYALVFWFAPIEPNVLETFAKDIARYKRWVFESRKIEEPEIFEPIQGDGFKSDFDD